jgi:hypothetical protein
MSEARKFTAIDATGVSRRDDSDLNVQSIAEFDALFSDAELKALFKVVAEGIVSLHEQCENDNECKARTAFMALAMCLEARGITNDLKAAAIWASDKRTRNRSARLWRSGTQKLRSNGQISDSRSAD